MRVAERFWEKVDRSGGPEACWPWLGATNKDGYGKFQVWVPETGKQRHVLAHRFALELLTCRQPPSVKAMHSCDNPICCNSLSHLDWGTQKQNLQDAAKKSKTARGAQNGSGRLTASQIQDIKNHVATGGPTETVARLFGVTERYVRGIVAGTRRKGEHVGHK
jgi:hypothetical protein